MRRLSIANFAPATELLPMKWMRSAGTSGSSPMAMQLAMSEPVAERPGDVDLLDVGEGQPDRPHQAVGGGVDRALGADEVFHVRLA